MSLSITSSCYPQVIYDDQEWQELFCQWLDVWTEKKLYQQQVNKRSKELKVILYSPGSIL